MGDIPAEKQGTEEVKDVNEATVAPQSQAKPAAQGVQSIDINLGNVEVLTLKLLAEIRDEIRALRMAVTMPRPVPTAAKQPDEGSGPVAQ
jgi:hypothetical protein